MSDCHLSGSLLLAVLRDNRAAEMSFFNLLTRRRTVSTGSAYTVELRFKLPRQQVRC